MGVPRTQALNVGLRDRRPSRNWASSMLKGKRMRKRPGLGNSPRAILYELGRIQH